MFHRRWISDWWSDDPYDEYDVDIEQQMIHRYMTQNEAQFAERVDNHEFVQQVWSYYERATESTAVITKIKTRDDPPSGMAVADSLRLHLFVRGRVISGGERLKMTTISRSDYASDSEESVLIPDSVVQLGPGGHFHRIFSRLCSRTNPDCRPWREDCSAKPELSQSAFHPAFVSFPNLAFHVVPDWPCAPSPTIADWRRSKRSAFLELTFSSSEFPEQ
jgi:hypothetical protein